MLIMLFASTSIVAAHPGRQNSDGGHVCRTNCPDWGLDYGEYHYHSYFNNGKSNNSTSPSSSSWSIPGWMIWGTIFIIVFIYFVVKSKSTPTYHRSKRGVLSSEIDYFPPPTSVIYPPDEEVELTGIITRTVYRKSPFFVAKFIDDEGNNHTVVGGYAGRLLTNKRYTIQGTNTYDRRYGQQIKVEKIELTR
jgi:hypothetical protein